MLEKRTSSGQVGRRPLRLAVSAALGAALPLVAPGFGALLAGCGAEGEATTSGRRVELETRLELGPEGASFTTPLDWSVTLTRAYLSIGVLRYFDGVPPIARLDATGASDSAGARFFGLHVAHAHPGHYQAGNVLGEMLVPSSVDLLSGTTVLEAGAGVSGWYRSGRFTLNTPPVGPFAEELEGRVAVVEGFAEKAAESRRWFRAVADASEVADSAPNGEVDGCVFEAVDVETDGTVTLRVSPSEWFTLVDFSELEPGSADEPSEFPAGSQPRIAFAQGVAELSAYRFSFQPTVQ